MLWCSQGGQVLPHSTVRKTPTLTRMVDRVWLVVAGLLVVELLLGMVSVLMAAKVLQMY